jgi:hypothetical protein
MKKRKNVFQAIKESHMLRLGELTFSTEGSKTTFGICE